MNPIYVQLLILTVLSWTELGLTYGVMNKAKKLGYSNWLDVEKGPIVRYFVKRYGIQGLLISSIINPIKYAVIVLFAQKFTTIGNLVSFAICLLLTGAVSLNYINYRLPDENYHHSLTKKQLKKTGVEKLGKSKNRGNQLGAGSVDP